MSYYVELGWKIFSSLSLQGPEDNPLFNIKGASSFIRSFGGNPRAPYAPATLEPTKNFHHALRPLKSMLGVEGKHFTFSIFFDNLQRRLQVTVGLRRYLSCMCASVKVEGFSIDCLAEVSALQDFRSHKGLFQFVSEILAISTAGSARQKKLPELPKVLPAIQIVNEGVQADDTLHRLVEILTRHTIQESNIVESVIQKNKTHSIDSTLVLIDRQGILSYLPPHCSLHQIKGNAQRFRNASSLMEFAFAVKRDLKSGFISADKVRPVINGAKYFIPDSISAQRMWELLVSEFSLAYEIEQATEPSMAPTLDDRGSCSLSSPHVNQIILNQNFSGGQYNIAGQAGAVGPNAKAESNIFTQVNQALVQEAGDLDLPALSMELAKLRTLMRKRATEVEHDQAVAYIGAAEISAKKQDVAGTLENLRRSGRWALDTANKTGFSVAVKAIQTAISLK